MSTACCRVPGLAFGVQVLHANPVQMQSRPFLKNAAGENGRKGRQIDRAFIPMASLYVLGLLDVKLPGKGNSKSHSATPVHQIISKIKWTRTSRLSIKNSLSTLPAARCGVKGLECGVQGSGSGVKGAGCEVQGVGFRVYGSRLGV